MPNSSVPIPTVDATGFHLPVFTDVLAAHQADYRSIYGSDVVLTSDTQDGEWVAIEAQGFWDCFTMAMAVYNSFSPATAQGTGLSSVVKVNGIAREVASYSTCLVLIVGQVGVTLTGCQARDGGGNLWSIPTTTIPTAGQITTTATCTTLGAVTAPAGTLNQIATPTLGWQSVTNLVDATAGAPVETDPQLRIRQSQSTALPSETTLDGIQGALLALPGVARLRCYENDEPETDAYGLPGNSIAIVIDGGNSQSICDTILRKKVPGVGTFGSATSPLPSYDAYDIPHVIRYFPPTIVTIHVHFTLKALPGFTTDYQTQIANAVSAWVNALGIGAGSAGIIRLSRLYGPALLAGTPAYDTFEIIDVTLSRDAYQLDTTDVLIAFNEAPRCLPGQVTFTVTT